MNWILSTPPAVEPVTTSELRAHARIDFIGDDLADELLIGTYITVARQHVEQVTWRQLITAKWSLFLNRFMATIELPKAPVQSIVSVTYVDAAGAVQTIDVAAYTLDPAAEPAILRPAYGLSWPTPRGDANCVTVEYLAGYGDTGASVPEPLKLAIKLLAAHWYEHREAVSDLKVGPVPFAVDSLLAPYRVWRAYA